MLKSVTHLSFSSAGGAGSVAHTLVTAQRDAGREAQLAHVIDSDLRAAPFATPAHTLAAGLDHYVVKAPTFSAPISVLRDALGGGLEAALQASEVIHLHGYNGALHLGDVAHLSEGKRVIWTLHDMNPFTGACHYSLGCDGYTNTCSSCPAVRSVFQSTVEKALIQKKHAIDAVSDLHVVAPSEWLAREARSSVVLAGRSVTVIPNPLSSVGSPQHSRSTAKDSFVATVVARNLSDPVKNVADAAAAFATFRKTHPTATLRLIGAGGDEFRGPGVEHLGSLTPEEIALRLSSSDVLVVPSRAENAPLVIVEAAAAGCPAIVRNVGGMPDMVRGIGHGSVFDTRDELVTALLDKARQSSQASQAARAELPTNALAIYGPGAVVAQYDGLYD